MRWSSVVSCFPERGAIFQSHHCRSEDELVDHFLTIYWQQTRQHVDTFSNFNVHTQSANSMENLTSLIFLLWRQVPPNRLHRLLEPHWCADFGYFFVQNKSNDAMSSSMSNSLGLAGTTVLQVEGQTTAHSASAIKLSDVRLYDRTASLLCPVFSLTNCSSMPLSNILVAAVTRKLWLV